MTYKVELKAFEGHGFRNVNVPDEILNDDSLADPEDILELIFEFGQNDTNPERDKRSVSVGDIIYLDESEKYEILYKGFKRL